MSIFTRRHYEWTATTLRRIYINWDQDDLISVGGVIEEIANAFANESPAFDRKLFTDNIYLSTSQTRKDRCDDEPHDEPGHR